MKKLFFYIFLLLVVVCAVILITQDLFVRQIPYPAAQQDYSSEVSTGYNYDIEDQSIHVTQSPIGNGSSEQGNASDTSSPQESAESPQSSPFLQPDVTFSPDELAKYEGRYAYQFLNGDDALLYKQIAASLDRHEDSIPLKISEPKDALRILTYVLADYPEFFWVDGGGTLITTTRNGEVVGYSLKFIYNMDENQRAENQSKVDAAAEACLSQIDAGWSEYEKVKAVYDYIIKNTDYNINRSSDQTLYGVMVLGEGVCAGYAKATQYLLNKLGIFCTYVTGNATGRGSHAWNLVRIDGEYYYLDTTWGDPVFTGDNRSGDPVSYDFFCITTDDLLKTHEIDTEWPLPECTALKCNYYVRNNLYFDEYSYEAMLPVVRNALAEGGKTFSFRFSGQTAYRQAVSRLFEENEIFSIIRDARPENSKEIDSLSYSLNGDLFIIKIFL